MCIRDRYNVVKFIQNSLVLIPYLLTYSQQCYVMTQMTLLRHIVFVHNVFCFNGFNRFTWFNMDRITKDYGCLIMGLQTEKNGGQTPNKRLSKQEVVFVNLARITAFLSITVTFKIADTPLTSINQTFSIDITSTVVCVLLGRAVTE